MKGNIKLVVTVFARLEFVVHPGKSIFVPTISIEYLGFIIDTQSMIISSTQMKKSSIKQSCQEVLQEEFLIIKKKCKKFPNSAFWPFALHGKKDVSQAVHFVNILWAKLTFYGG